MNIQQPPAIIEKPLESVQALGENINNVTEQIGENISLATKGITKGINEFSSPEKIGTASSQFLQSNSLIAKLVFLLLVVIIFFVCLRLGISLLGYFLQPPNNPYVVNGMIQGTNVLTIPRDPKQTNSLTIKHSNNQRGGLEFSWSFWLNLQNAKGTSKNSTYSHIFSVGNNSYDGNGIATVQNGPGVYLGYYDTSGNIILTTNTSSTVQSAGLHIVMDSVPDGSTTSQTTDVTNVPFNKWFNVVLRMKNTTMDVYINGTITNRLNFTNVPRQNYGDIQLCGNGGFVGSLSNLRYYDYALNVFDITSIVYWGPKTTSANIGNVSTGKGGYNYLSSSWYSAKLT